MGLLAEAFGEIGRRRGSALLRNRPLLVHVGNAFRIEIRGDFAAPVLEKLVRTLTQL